MVFTVSNRSSGFHLRVSNLTGPSISTPAMPTPSAAVIYPLPRLQIIHGTPFLLGAIAEAAKWTHGDDEMGVAKAPTLS